MSPFVGVQQEPYWYGDQHMKCNMKNVPETFLKRPSPMKYKQMAKEAACVSE